MKRTNAQHRITGQSPLPWLALLLIFLLSVMSNSHASCISTNPVPVIQTRTYQIYVTSSNDNLSISYFGREQLTLNSTDAFSYLGYLSWNLTWDNGHTWYADNTNYTYSPNRTYNYSGVICYTAWWINPSTQLGEQIRIDGDLPATNNFLRIAPFTVTDLISIEVANQYVNCWQLSYLSGNRQHELYYYEYHTGILVRAVSLLRDSTQYVHEIYLELLTATPSLPSNSPILHYWTNYNSIILSLIGATLVALFFYYFLQRYRPRHPNRPPPSHSEHNA